MFGKKCKVCKTKLPKGEQPLLRVDTIEGIIELEICETCADFFDKSSDVFRGEKDEQDESI